MTREQVADEIYNKYFKDTTIFVPSYIEIILLRLEEMGLIKFESKREAAIKEAECYIGKGLCVPVSSDSTARLVQIISRLVALLK